MCDCRYLSFRTIYSLSLLFATRDIIFNSNKIQDSFTAFFYSAAATSEEGAAEQGHGSSHATFAPFAAAADTLA